MMVEIKWDRETIITAIQDDAKKYGHPSSKRLAAANKSVKREFGNWCSAYDAAGVSSRSRKYGDKVERRKGKKKVKEDCKYYENGTCVAMKEMYCSYEECWRYESGCEAGQAD